MAKQTIRRKKRIETVEVVEDQIQSVEQESEKHWAKHWKKDRIKQAYKLALLGANDKDIADFFECSIRIIYHWRQTKPEFREALNRGKMEANANVAYAAYKKCIGFEYEEEHVTYVKGVPQVVTVRRYMPPDTMAIFRWMAVKGRGQGWTLNADNKTGDVHQMNVLNIGSLDLKQFSVEQLKVIEQLGLQRLTLAENGNGQHSAD